MNPQRLLKDDIFTVKPVATTRGASTQQLRPARTSSQSQGTLSMGTRPTQSVIAPKRDYAPIPYRLDYQPTKKETVRRLLTKQQPRSTIDYIADFGKGLVSGIQQGLGAVGDVALQGGAILDRTGIQTNPFISDGERQRQLQKFDLRTANKTSNTERARGGLQSQKDFSGDKIVGTSDVDENAARIATGRGNLRDFTAVGGKALETGLSATMFANPTALARGAGKKLVNTQLAKYVAKDAALFGGTQGVATGLKTYGQTGDVGKALQQGGQAALLTGVTQGALDTLGYGLSKAPQVASAVKEAIPTAEKLTQANPEIVQLKQSAETLFSQRNRLVERGTNPNSTAIKQYDRAIKQLGEEYTTTYKRVYNQSKLELQRGSVQVPGGKKETPAEVSNPSKQSTQFEHSLQEAGIAPKATAQTIVSEVPTAKSTFANQTVRTSKEVSDPLKAQVRSTEPTFQTVTDAGRIAQSDAYLKKAGIQKATTDVKERLASKQIDDQTVSDAIAVAKALDQKGNPANLLEASAIYEELSVKLSKAGQTVQAASLLNNRTPAGLQYGAIRALKQSGVEITDQMKKDIGGLVDNVRKTKPGSYEDGFARFKLQGYVSKKVPSGNTSKLVQLWKAGLLTSPRTTAGNLLGNTAESIFLKGYVDPLANALDTVFSLFTGKASRSFTLRGIGSGTGEGIGKAVSYFKTGYDPRNPAQKFDVRQIHYSDKPLGKAAEAYTQTVFKLMGVADQPFYYANLRNSLYDQAITAAVNKGLTGAEKKAFIKKFVTEPEAKTMQLADAEARYAVFQDETQLGKAASKIKNMDGIAGDIAEFVIPFSGVPSSIATRMIMRTPIGIAHEIVKQVRSKKFDQRAMTKAIANGLAAIPLIGAGYALASSGEMTLGYPTDKTERDLWEAEGKQPYSIKVGDQWLSLNYLQPAGNLMAAGAEYAGSIKAGETPQEAFNTALAGTGKALSEQSFLKGVSGIGNAIADPARFGQKFAEQTAGSLIPNAVRTGARAIDPVKRETNSMLDAVTAGIPGLRQIALDPKTNILGEEVPRNSSILNELINPLKPSDIQNADNPTVKELRRLEDSGNGITPTQATKSSFEGLDDKTIGEVNKRTSTEVSSEWDRVLKDPRYEMLGDEDKKRLLDRVNDTVFGAVKSDYKEDTELTKRSKLYKNGTEVDYFSDFEKSGDDGISSKLNKDSQSYNFLLETSNISEDEKGAWGQEAVDPKYKPLVDSINSAIPKDLPKLPETNAVAELYAEFEKNRADNGWSELQTQDESKKLVVKAYQSQLTDNEKFLSTLSDNEILSAAESGQITKEELDRLEAIDRIITRFGGQAVLGKKLRTALGYGQVASTGGSGSGKAKKSKAATNNYKVFGFEGASPESVGQNLRKLIEKAVI